jgi:hypothetical protein
MYIAIFCLGVVLIVLEVVASRSNRRFAVGLPADSRWLMVYRWRFPIGVPLAIASAFVSYPLTGGGEQYQVSGFPFLVMAIDQRGWDYVGFMSIPFFVVNCLIWLFLPTLGLWVWSRSRKPDAKSVTPG